VESQKAWRFAGDLRVGDLLKLEDGRLGRVVGHRERAERARTFNFEVEGLHTYFVGQDPGWRSVLVHNQSHSSKAAAKKRLNRNKKVGDKASDAIASQFSTATREKPVFHTSVADRRPDVFIKRSGRMIESKVGRTGLTRRVRQELAADAELLSDASFGVRKVTWEFRRSKTGIGPTRPLRTHIQQMQKRGLNIEMIIRK
jgi:hypothetical protein